MLFNSLKFCIFFIIVLCAFYIVPRKIRWIVLLIASYIFYMAWNPVYVFLLLGMTFTTYISGLFVDKSEKKWKKIWLIVAICINIGLLIYFKYMNFFAEISQYIIRKLGFSVADISFDILLPVGISFISFQSLGYVIDVYRGDVDVQKNFFKYALFVAFFPQLVAGPIERSSNLLNQISNVENQKRMSYEKFTGGCYLILLGYFQKMVIADNLAIIVDTVFEDPMKYSSLSLIVAAISFSLEIYCDFSGYSNIAIGSAKILGFDMIENFNAPYFATSIKDFWRRWHISLSTWFRDYVYIPLGGNRKGNIRKYINILITFLLSGLWHGAHMHYVIWGGIHGLYQVCGDVIRKIATRIHIEKYINTKKESFRLLKILVTFSLTTIAWVFFRANNTQEAVIYIVHMFDNLNLIELFNGELYTLGLDEITFSIVVLCIIILYIFDRYRENTGLTIDGYLEEQNLWLKWTVLIILIYSIFIFGKYGIDNRPANFIYFQF